MVAAEDAKDVATVEKAGFVDLGVIKGNIGDQNYTLPDDLDLAEIPRGVHMVQTIQREFRSYAAKTDGVVAESLEKIRMTMNSELLAAVGSSTDPNAILNRGSLLLSGCCSNSEYRKSGFGKRSGGTCMKAKNSETEFIVTLTLIVADIARSVAFYRDVLVAMVLRGGRTYASASSEHLDNY
jgi:hypothetical protein